jgi:hypothetical protein
MAALLHLVSPRGASSASDTARLDSRVQVTLSGQLTVRSILVCNWLQDECGRLSCNWELELPESPIPPG